MDREILTPSEETRMAIRESRQMRREIKKGDPFFADDVNKVIGSLITLIQEQTDFLAHDPRIYHRLRSSIQEQTDFRTHDRRIYHRLRSSLRSEINALVKEAIEAARKEEPLIRSKMD